jgi:hypothetical protein
VPVLVLEQVEGGEGRQVEPSWKISVVSMPPSVRKQAAVYLRQPIAVLHPVSSLVRHPSWIQP